MATKNNLSLYPISEASEMLGVHPRTLRIYEDEGLIKPKRSGGKRLFSKNDILWVQCIRALIHDDKLSIPGIKKLLQLLPCWKLKGCPPKVRNKCSVLKEIEKKCWEHTKQICKKSCSNCDVYLKESSK